MSNWRWIGNCDDVDKVAAARTISCPGYRWTLTLFIKTWSWSWRMVGCWSYTWKRGNIWCYYKWYSGQLVNSYP